MEKLVLHEDPISGNCYKIKLTPALLGLRMECRAYSVLHGETRTPQFLNFINPNGRIPVLQIGDRFLPESSAACFYLADGSRLIPDDRFDRADMLRWRNQVAGLSVLEQELAAAGRDGDFYDGKRAAARYFFGYELPRTRPQLDLLESLDRTTLDMRDAWF